MFAKWRQRPALQPSSVNFAIKLGEFFENAPIANGCGGSHLIFN
jgi:hypothetical protein